MEYPDITNNLIIQVTNISKGLSLIPVTEACKNKSNNYIMALKYNETNKINTIWLLPLRSDIISKNNCKEISMRNLSNIKFTLSEVPLLISISKESALNPISYLLIALLLCAIVFGLFIICNKLIRNYIITKWLLFGVVDQYDYDEEAEKNKDDSGRINLEIDNDVDIKENEQTKMKHIDKYSSFKHLKLNDMETDQEPFE